jgi:flagellar protein FlaJ
MTDFEFRRLEHEDEITDSALNRERTLFVILAEAFYEIYRFLKGTEFVENFDDRMKAANISRDSEVFLSGVLAIGTISGGIVGLTTLILANLGISGISGPVFRFAWLPLPEIVITVLNPLSILVSIGLMASFGALVGLLGGMTFAAVYPWAISRKRRREIGLVLPDSISFMYSLSTGGGMTQMDIFRAVADSEDVFGELSVEFQRIMVGVDGFGDDFQTSVQEVADTTPNEELQKFLTELLSRINSGASMNQYLEEAMEGQRRTRKRKLETILNLLDLVGQMYMTLNFAPMLLVIILVMMSLTGEPKIYLLLGTIYIIQPAVNALYGAFISSVDEDNPGDGYIRLEDGTVPGKQENSILSLGPVDNYPSDPVFRQIRRNEYFYSIQKVASNPFKYLLDNPEYTFVFTVPASIFFMVIFTVQGSLVPTVDAFVSNTMAQMLGYFLVPFTLIVMPYTVLFEYNEYTRQKITDTLADDLRRLANINATDKPLTEALDIVYKDSDSKLSEEFGIMHSKLEVGIPLDQSLIEFNNKYHIPRLARMVKILERAQEVSDHIEDVLETAAKTAEYQQRIEKDRYMRMLMQVIVIEMAFLVYLGIMAAMNGYLIERVITAIGDGPGWGNFERVNPDLINVLFFHSVLIQGITSGLLAGYVQTDSLRKGLKYTIINTALAYGVWLILPYIKF